MQRGGGGNSFEHVRKRRTCLTVNMTLISCQLDYIINECLPDKWSSSDTESDRETPTEATESDRETPTEAVMERLLSLYCSPALSSTTTTLTSTSFALTLSLKLTIAFDHVDDNICLNLHFISV